MEMKIIGPSRVGIAFAWSGTVRQHQHDRSQVRALAMPAYRYVEENSSAAMLPAQRLADVSPEVNLMSPGVQNRGISGPTKGTYVLQKLF